MGRVLRSPFYIFFIAILPIVSRLSANINQLAPVEGLRTILLVLAVGGGLLLFVGLVTGQWHRAALVIALFLFGFLSYGHLYNVFANITKIESTDINYALTSAAFLIVLIGLVLFIWFRLKNPERLTFNLNIISSVMLLLPLYTFGSYLIENRSPAVPLNSSLEIPDSAFSTSFRPDIYYIVLDGYARADILSAVFQYDNSPFIDELTERGFFVASNSHTNYISTVPSLASSLNLQYLDKVAQDEGIDSRNLTPLSNMVQNNQVDLFLKKLNYETITISSGYENTEIRRVDHYLSSAFRGINEFETLTLQLTPIGRYFVRPGRLLEDGLQYAPQRDRVRFSFDSLANSVPEIASPKFVFAHIVSPHPPFVFGPNGEATQPDYPHTIGDGTDFPGTTAEYLEGYRNQITYVNKLLLESVDQILIQSQSKPIIVIQSDHGSGAFLQWTKLEDNGCLKERASNFVAVLTPDSKAQFYDSITPVNIFRILFNSYFETDFELLPDKTFFVVWNKAYDYSEITDRIESSDACLMGAIPAQ